MSKLKQYFNILLTFYADYFNHIYRASLSKKLGIS